MADGTVTGELQKLSSGGQASGPNEFGAAKISQEKLQLLELATCELRDRRDALQREINELRCRKQQLEEDIYSSFAGKSDAIARHVKGFQEYLSGALQGLAQRVDQLELVAQPLQVQPSPLDRQQNHVKDDAIALSRPAIAEIFRPDEDLIRSCLQQFLSQPDFYADPWKLRRSLGKTDVALLEDWFFSQGGRGAQFSRGLRAHNALVGAAIIAVLGELYGDRFQCLVLAGEPEHLGEWRRGLQDALGLKREDFGPNGGIVLFDRGEALIERADRLEDQGELPLILVDSSEHSIDVALLQFPLWLAFAIRPGRQHEDSDSLSNYE